MAMSLPKFHFISSVEVYIIGSSFLWGKLEMTIKSTNKSKRREWTGVLGRRQSDSAF